MIEQINFAVESINGLIKNKNTWLTSLKKRSRDNGNCMWQSYHDFSF